MKIGILTFCNGYNYGAILQCYALQRFLNNNKIDAEIINFKKEKMFNKKGYNFLSMSYLLRKIYAFFYQKQIKIKKTKFNNFFKNNIRHFPNDSVDENNVTEIAKRYDIIIFGSDQIWNMNEKIYDRSKIFFGDFEFSGKRISYAASFGDSIEVAKQNADYIKKMLKKFDAISVREKTGNDFLSEYGISNDLVVDPTLLLKANEWNKLCKKSTFNKIPKKYILYYSVNCKKYSWKIAKKLSKLTGIKVINLEEHPKIFGANFINDYTEGPEEFLYLIKNAEYIVTNSFHGTIFSLIFNKKLIPVFENNSQGIIKEERKYSLLELADLLNIITTENMPLKVTNYNVDYKKTSKKMNKVITFSQNYLLEKCGDKYDKF